MPALIGLSPRLADHTFPRDDYELRLVARALGKLSELVDNQTVRILRTEFFVTLLTEFKWDGNGSLKNQIFTHLNLWFLHGKAVAVQADIGAVPHMPHPIPENCQTQQGLEEIWADEMGRLLVFHDDYSRNGEYFIGIACEKAFAGNSIGQYEPHTCSRFFPLVGPDNCDCSENNSLLANAFEPREPPGYTHPEVSFEAAQKNCFALGASEVRKPKRGSHYKVKFHGARSWILDPNDDPVPEAYLKQLEQITGFRLGTIIYTLREGKLPPLRLRFY
jgi:hypothetical protein